MLFIAAPVCVIAYGLIRIWGMSDDQYGPGFDWQAAHVVALLGMILFVPVVLAMRRLLPRSPWRTATVAAVMTGLVASMVQFGADIVFAAQAADKAEMRTLSRKFSDIPGVDIAIYKVGPLLFFVGLVVLCVLLAVNRKVPWWSPAIMLAGIVLPPINLDFMPLAGLTILIALLPAAKQARLT